MCRSVRLSRKKGRQFLFLSILLLSVLYGAGCGGAGTVPDEDASSVDPEISRVDSPVQIRYLVQNPLTIETTETTEKPDFVLRSFSIDGLLDDELETRINADLASATGSMMQADAPGYRGIRRLLPTGSELVGNTVDASASFNYNNILSVLIYGHKVYVTSDSTGAIPADADWRMNHTVYVGMAETRNIDLATGNQITLKDVFTDDADYLRILNDHLKSKFARNNADDEGFYGGVEMYGLKLAAPFRGIDADQDFYLSQGGLVLIFDQDDPEFDTGLYPQMIYINFAELEPYIAVTERFKKADGTLYAGGGPPVKEFVQSWPGEDVVQQENATIGPVHVYYSIRYPKSIPETARALAMALYEPDTARIEALAAVEPGADGGSSYEQYVWASVSGEFTTVTRSLNVYSAGRWTSETENYCFAADGRKLEIADLFKGDYDYQAAIKKGLAEAIAQMPVKPEATVDELVGDLSFSIGLAELSFMTRPIPIDPQSIYPINFYLPYKTIGCDNLTIFD